MPSPCCRMNKHKSMNILIFTLEESWNRYEIKCVQIQKETHLQQTSDVACRQHGCCPIFLWMENYQQHLSETKWKRWLLTKVYIHIYYEVNYKLCTSRTPSCPSQSISSVCFWNRPLVLTEEHKWLERCDQEVGILNLYYGLVSWLGDWLSTLETFCGFLLTPELSFSWQPHNIGI